MDYFHISPWLSWQKYTDVNGTFIVVSDSRMHTFGIIEGRSAEIWKEIFPDAKSRLASPPSPPEFLEFFSLLIDEELVIDVTNSRLESAAQKPPTPIFLSSDAGPSDLEYQKLEEDIKSRVEASGKLWSFFWETTYTCNEKCIHCFNPGASHGPGEKTARSHETIERGKIESLLDDLRDIGVFRIVFSGGEFFVNKDWEYILHEAHRRGFELHIFTNGLLLDDSHIAKLCGFWPQSVSVSIYSHDPQIHDKITRTPFSHHYSLTALKKLAECGIKTTIKCPLTHMSAGDVDSVITLGRKLGARIAFDSMISAGNDGNKSPIALNASWKQLLALSLQNGSPICVTSQDSRYGSVDKDPDLHVCGAGRSIMSMTPNGRLTPCCALPIEVGNIHDLSIKDVWQTAIAQEIDPSTNRKSSLDQPSTLFDWRSVKLKNYYECGSHDRCAWCNKCPGSALNETGDVFSPSLVQCKIASARMSVANLLRDNIAKEDILIMIDSGMIPEPQLELM